MDLYLRSTIGTERDLALVRHFVEHYSRLGFEKFLFVLHGFEASSRNLVTATEILHEHGIQPAATWITRSWGTGENSNWHRRIVAGLPSSAWIATADIDEFQQYPTDLRTFVQELERQNYELVKGRLVERIARNFRLPPLLADQCIFTQFPLEASFHIGNPGKIILHRNYVKTTPGHHYFEESSDHPLRVYPGILKVAHFKWFEGVAQKYTDPCLMAHHSEHWEFGAYERFIKSNFCGWRRYMNIVRYNPPAQPFVDCLLTLARSCKSFVGRFLRRAR
jgi:hypothetical protein